MTDPTRAASLEWPILLAAHPTAFILALTAQAGLHSPDHCGITPILQDF